MKNKIYCQALFLLACGSNVFAKSQYNMPEGVTPMSHAIYGLHMLIFYICVAIAVVVFVAMGYCCYKHRKSKGAVAAKFHDNVALEIIWTIIPTLILVAMAVPATKVLMEIHDTAKSDVDIKIVGMQWRWKYEYLNQGVSFMSSLSTPQRQLDGYDPKGKFYLREVDRPMVVPIHKKIRFLVTSSDVQHSWWVPEFGVKRDAIPGLLTSSWAKVDRVGIYRGKCTELCGMRHGYMPIVVYAVTDEDYHIWLKRMKKNRPLSQKTLEEMAGYHSESGSDKLQPSSVEPNLVEQKKAAVVNKKAPGVVEFKKQGEQVYQRHCVACHLSTGKGMPPAFKALKGSPIVVGEASKLMDVVLYGVQGKAMQAFGDKLTDKELSAVLTYIKNSWGNEDKNKYGEHAGGMISSHTIIDYRAKK